MAPIRPASAAIVLLLAAALPGAGCGPAPPGVRPAPPATLEPATARQVLAAAREPGATATLVNVWATWCAPCREEFPDLVRLQRAYADRGLRVLFVSGDAADARDDVLAFLRGQGVAGRTFLKDGADQEFIDTLDPRWSGALPATFVFAADGTVREFWEGKATYEELERRVAPLLGEPDRRAAAAAVERAEREDTRR